MLSMPKAVYDDENIKWREVIRPTYENAIMRGDKNVFFIDGETYFDGVDSQLCFVDTTHPNDIGFFCMAEKIKPILEKLI